VFVEHGFTASEERAVTLGEKGKNSNRDGLNRSLRIVLFPHTRPALHVPLTEAQGLVQGLDS